MAASSASLDVVSSRVALIRKIRKLPLPGEVLVAQSQRVEPDTVVARISQRPGIPWVVPVASHLDVPPGELPSYLIRSVGDLVKAQEIIAVKNLTMGSKKEYHSPVAGRIENISNTTGRVTIREEFGRDDKPVHVNVAEILKCKPSEVPQNMIRETGHEVKQGEMLAKKGEMQAFLTKTAVSPVSGIVSSVDGKTGIVTITRPFRQVEVKAYLSGVVSSVMPGEGCVVETPGIRLSGTFGVGGETFGEIMVLTKSCDEVVTPMMLGRSCEGKVIVGGSLFTDEALQRALELGAKAVITGTVNYLNLTKSLGVKLGVGITGHEDVPMSVILTEGFGCLGMREETFGVLKTLEGHVVSVNGATQIRAGAVRPEIIIPLLSYEGDIGNAGSIDEDLRVGMRIRMVMEPHFGAIGTITRVVREPAPIATEAKVPVLEVDLGTKGIVLTPRSNVEVY